MTRFRTQMFAIFMLETELSYEGVKMHGSFLLVFTMFANFDHAFCLASRPHITPPPLGAMIGPGGVL